MCVGHVKPSVQGTFGRKKESPACCDKWFAIGKISPNKIEPDTGIRCVREKLDQRTKPFEDQQLLPLLDRLE